MIINADNKQTAAVNAMLTFLEKRGVPESDRALAEQYLYDEKGDEVLDQFHRIDFYAATITYEVRNEMHNILTWRDKEETKALCTRFLNVLYAIGHHTCNCLSYGDLSDKMAGCDLYKQLVVFMEFHMNINGYLDTYDTDHMLSMVQNKPDTLVGILDQIKGEGDRYYLAALSVYFYKKYAARNQIEAADATLMKAYEEETAAFLDEWLEQQGYAMHEEILSAVHQHQFTRALFDGVKMGSLSEPARQQLCFLCNISLMNFPLSEVLREIVKVCMAVDAEWMLLSGKDFILRMASDRRKTGIQIGDLDEVLGIEPETYIRWAADQLNEVILKRQLEKNQQSVLNAMDEEGYTSLLSKKNSTWNSAMDSVNYLKDLVKKENPKLYEDAVVASPNYETVIAYLVKDTPNAELAREYLRGHGSIEALYPYAEEYAGEYVSHRYMEAQKKHCNDPGFFNRCKAFMILTCSEKTTFVERWDTDCLLQIGQCYQMFCDEHLDIAHQIAGFAACYGAYDNSIGCSVETLLEGTVKVFTRYLSERREETLAAFFDARVEGRYLGLLVMKQDAERNKNEILRYTADSAKLIKEELLELLCAQKGWEQDIIALFKAKKAAQREMAVKVLSRWQEEGSNFTQVLTQAMEQEKNAKVLALLQSALNIQESDQQQEVLSKEELVKQLHKGGKKKSLTWAYETPFQPVHDKNGAEADEAYLQAILLCYVSQEKNGVNKNAKLLADELQEAELAVYMNELFDRWLAAGAESKKRWVLYAAAIHGGEEIIQKIQHQIQEWPQAARGAIAAEAVKALALNPSPRALLLVDSIARKFKFKQVKAAAGEALEFAAKELDITREELSDRIVPDLGFDGQMERTFDYGGRVFRVRLTTALEIEVFDENGKKLKSLPAPGKKDDEQKAAAAYEEFKQMKKQMKTTVSSQKARLEYALSAKREWSAAAWTNLFVQNPLMHQFAIGLIWGIYEGDRLVQSFRYMEDGSFNTQDEEEYTLPEGARISLVHPMELTDEEKAAWKEQLSDYEITQPIEQLDRAVYDRTEEEAAHRSMERFGGYIINDLSLNGKLTGLGWYRGSVQDAGGFYTYYREDPEVGIGVELHFSGTYVGMMGEDVTIYDVRFYKAGSVERGSYVYDEADKEKAYLLKDIPARYFSEIVLQLTKATASSQSRDEDWRKDVQLI